MNFFRAMWAFPIAFVLASVAGLLSSCSDSPEFLAMKQERHEAWLKKLGNCSKVEGVLQVRSCPALITYEFEKGSIRAIMVLGLNTDGTIHYVRASDQVSSNDGWTIDPASVHRVYPIVNDMTEQFKRQRRWVE